MRAWRRLFWPRWLRSGRVLLGLLVVLAVLALAVFAPALAPHNPEAQDLSLTLQPVRLGSPYPLGTDGLGRCVLSRLLFGTRLGLSVAVVAAFGAMLLGSVLAYAAGYLGGWTDWLIGRVMDVWMTFPPLVLSVILMVGLGTGSGNVILAIMLVDWTRFCRVLRSEVMVIARRDHVVAARLLGFSHWRTLALEVVPASIPLLVTLLVLEMGIAVVVQTILAFVGLGVTPDQVAWGQMIADGRDAIYQAPANFLAPVAAIFVAVAGFNLLGDGLRRTLGRRLVERAHDEGPAMTLLVVRGLAVEAEVDGEIVPVLRGLNFALSPGRVLGLVGESGAGKSLVGRAIAQVLPPGFATSAGSIAFDGEELVAMPERRRRALLGRDIAFIPQDPLGALNPVQTIGAQLAEHHRRLGVRGRRVLRDYGAAALAGVHLPDPVGLLSRYPHQLSGGQCQRVLVAMAFAGRPKLVVADEATAALDVTTQAHIIALMRELQRDSGAAVLFITHDLRLAAGICDDIAVMHAGDIIEIGAASKVLHQPRHPYTRCLQLSSPPMTGPRRALFVLPEPTPGLRALARLAGCRFALRCPVCAEYCLRSEPPLEGDAHRSSCLRPGLVGTIDVGGALPSPPWRPAGEAPVLEVAGLSKQFATGAWPWRSRVDAVREVSLRIAPGEFVGVVGESGSGKSTLGRLVVGLEQPSAGRVTLAGVDVTAGDEAARLHRVATVQMVFQDAQSALNPRRRVSAIITQALEARRTAHPAREKRARELLAEMGMALELGVRTPGQLSGGQRQLVNIARALCSVPRLLVADEVVLGLDVSVQAQLLALLHRLRRDHDFALLFISHDLSMVRHLCDRVLVMHQGEIVEEGPTETVFGWPRHECTRALLGSVPW